MKWDIHGVVHTEGGTNTKWNTQGVDRFGLEHKLIIYGVDYVRSGLCTEWIMYRVKYTRSGTHTE